MKRAHGFRSAMAVAALTAATGLLTSGLAGCGTPGAPLPPSLNLPDPVSDLSATRTGDVVQLTWTMPGRNTDKLKLKDNIVVRICRREGEETCTPASPQSGVALAFGPKADGQFTETLPPALATGAPRKLTYFVELKNKKGRSAGPSNGAVILAGQAPPQVVGLAAVVRRQGVVLHWAANAGPVSPDTSTVIRLHRKLVSAPPAKPQEQPGILAPEPEPVERSLVVESPDQTPRAIDKDIRLGQAYEYRAQRVIRVALKGPAEGKQPQTGHAPAAQAQAGPSDQDQTLELPGPLSDPIRVEATDIFPPEIPTGLAAIATQTSSEISIDLSWKANTDADLAGYAVYRRDGDGPWQRISAAEPVVGPAFHDAHVRPGQLYRYAVTSIDLTGHESGRSAEAEETAPQP